MKLRLGGVSLCLVLLFFSTDVFSQVAGREGVSTASPSLADLHSRYRAEQIAIDSETRIFFESIKDFNSVDRRDAIKAFTEQNKERLKAQQELKKRIERQQTEMRESKETTVRSTLIIPPGVTEKERKYREAKYRQELAYLQLQDSVKNLSPEERRNAMIVFTKEQEHETERIRRLQREAVEENLSDQEVKPFRNLSFDLASLPQDISEKQRRYLILRGRIQAEQALLQVELNGMDPITRRDTIIQWQKENATRLKRLQELQKAVRRENRGQTVANP